MWNLKKWYKLTYLRNRNRVTDVENKLMVTKGERHGVGGGLRRSRLEKLINRLWVVELIQTMLFFDIQVRGMATLSC